MVDLLGAPLVSETPEESAIIADAGARAQAVIGASQTSESVQRLVPLLYAADLVPGLARQREWSRDDMAALLERVAEQTELPLDTVADTILVRALRDARLLQLPTGAAVESVLTLLYVLSPVSELSLWRVGPRGNLKCDVQRGGSNGNRSARLEARRAVGQLPDAGSPRRTFQALPVVCDQRAVAALVVRPAANARDRALAHAYEAVAVLGRLLEKEKLIDSTARTERLLRQTERRLVRFGLDLHDGPIQDVAALALELHLFRAELQRAVRDADREHVAARLDDVQARVKRVEIGLRAMSQVSESAPLIEKPLADALREEVEALGATGVDATLRIEGDFENLSDSQRIAVYRIVQEALANVREHSGATRLSVEIVRRRSGVSAVIEDNGRGFDVEETVARSARGGRLGFVGMRERARLLGGKLDVESSSGGPTRVSLMLPAWSGELRRRSVRAPA